MKMKRVNRRSDIEYRISKRHKALDIYSQSAHSMRIERFMVFAKGSSYVINRGSLNRGVLT